MMASILSAYGLDENQVTVNPFGSGLINHTWLVKTPHGDLILQRINHDVFKQPAGIARNIKLISHYLSEHHPDYLFVMPQQTLNNDEMLYVDGQGYFRVFNFIRDSHSIDVVTTPAQAYEAAAQFGRFTKLLSGFPADTLSITLPDFHNLTLRFSQFEHALQTGNEARMAESRETIDYLLSQRSIADTFESIRNNEAFKVRVTHHDTKISNVLFDSDSNAICVIDLDTMMPGYFISDVGDMMRTYLSPANEEERDFRKISIREDYFKAISDGYLSEMREELTAFEKQYFVYSGKFMIYMQALRFLTDHLQNDIYYGAAYEGHNLQRARNQATLLQRLTEKEEMLTQLSYASQDTR